jgi:hypothetical protein
MRGTTPSVRPEILIENQFIEIFEFDRVSKFCQRVKLCAESEKAKDSAKLFSMRRHNFCA